MLIHQRNDSGVSNPKSEIRNPKSNGFTLVELLVAVALTIAIMGIIGWSMGRMTDTMRNLNGIANMQTKLAVTQIVMQRDLSAEHFGGNFRPGFSGPYVSDQRLDLIGWMPPEMGYFEIQNGPSGAGVFEGTDPDGLRSMRVTDHRMRFTVRLSGKREDDWIYAYSDTGAALPAGVQLQGDANFNRNGGIATRWGEVAYFLVQTTDRNANGTPLFTLYRRQRAILPNQTAVNAGWNPPPVLPPTSTDIARIAAVAAAGDYASPAQVTDPANRIPFTALPASLASSKQGDDILMTDVISFDIRPLWTTGPASARMGPPPTLATINFPGPASLAGNHDFPFDVMTDIPAQANPSGITVPAWGRRFDTMSQLLTAAQNTNWDDASSATTGFQRADTGLPRYRVRVHALQIRIRIWDFNTQQTRQITLVQDV